jgi:hypothetical protein
MALVSEVLGSSHHASLTRPGHGRGVTSRETTGSEATGPNSSGCARSAATSARQSRLAWSGSGVTAPVGDFAAVGLPGAHPTPADCRCGT